jgi:hypothetical protein
LRAQVEGRGQRHLSSCGDTPGNVDRDVLVRREEGRDRERIIPREPRRSTKHLLYIRQIYLRKREGFVRSLTNATTSARVSTQHTFATRDYVHRASNWTTAEGKPVKGRSDSGREAVAPETLAPGEGGSRKENRTRRGSRGRTLFRAFLVQDAVAALAADDDVPGTKHDLRPAICSRDTRRGRGQSGNSRNPREGRRANPGEEGRDLTSAVVRHARGARVLVIHVTPVHDASRRRVSAIRSSRGCANDVVAAAASGSFLRRAEKKFWPKLRESKFASFGRSGRGSAQPASARRRARGMAKDKAPAKSGKATAEPRHDPGWERVRMRSLARLRVVPRSLPREPSSDRQSSPLFDAGGGERGVGSTGGRVAGRI